MPVNVPVNVPEDRNPVRRYHDTASMKFRSGATARQKAVSSNHAAIPRSTLFRLWTALPSAPSCTGTGTFTFTGGAIRGQTLVLESLDVRLSSLATHFLAEQVERFHGQPNDQRPER